MRSSKWRQQSLRYLELGSKLQVGLPKRLFSHNATQVFQTLPAPWPSLSNTTTQAFFKNALLQRSSRNDLISAKPMMI